MRRSLALVLLLAASCASAPSRRCLDLSGTFDVQGICEHQGTGSQMFWFGDNALVKEVRSLTIDQPGCTLHIHVIGDDGVDHEAVLDRKLDWSDDGVSFNWGPTALVGGILPGTSRQTRTISLTMSDDRTKLTVLSEYDERGLALLFMPFHDHGQASCTLVRRVER